jgi:hypothetical protein
MTKFDEMAKEEARLGRVLIVFERLGEDELR